MKKIILLLLLISSISFANEKSRYAELSIRNISDFTISPNEELYIFTDQETYFKTNKFNTSWSNITNSFFKNKQTYGKDLSRINFFNKDCAILSGNLHEGFYNNKSNLFRTVDGGLNWEKITFNDNVWVYDVYLNRNGEGWLGGSSGNIFYTNNYGASWSKNKSPFNENSRLNSIFMINNKGIAGALMGNLIYKTYDNWQTYSKIETPLDQNNILKRNKFENGVAIEKVIFWDKYIVVSQNCNIFYTDTSTINWKRFNPDLKDFAYDEDNNILYGITVDSKVLKINSINEYKYLTSIQNNKYIIKSKAQNNSLYILNNNIQIYKIKDTLVEIDFLLTKDNKIPDPPIIKYGKNLIFGINGNNIYLADDELLNWYRVDILDKEFEDINIINDSTIILWDGVENNYIYNLKEKKIENYYYMKPIDSFLQNPITESNISSGFNSCWSGGGSDIKYENLDNSYNNSNFENILYSIENSLKLSADKVAKILNLINENPYKLPTKSEFQFTTEDYNQYFLLLDTIFQENKNYLDTSFSNNIDFFRNIKNVLDTIKEENFVNIFKQKQNYWDTSACWFKFNFINSKNDTLLVELNCNSYQPKLLPMRISFKDAHFISYNLELLNYMKDFVPIGFSGQKKILQKRFMLVQLATLIFNSHKE